MEKSKHSSSNPRPGPQQAQVSIIAHRGVSAEAPENSIAAFQRAIDLGCDWMECDVHLSADGVPVVVHDPELRGSPVSEQSADMLGLPTLAEVLALDRKGTGLMIELKVDCVDAVLSLVRDQADVVVGSLSPAIVRKVPSRLAIGIARTPADLQAHRTLSPWQMAVSHELDCAGHWVWTVDDLEQARAAIAAGATGIITNDPRALIAHL